MLTGNKGEWSEIYTFLKLLAEGKLYAADSDLNKLNQIYYPIIKILRTEANVNWEYVVNGDIIVCNGDTDQVVLKLPVKEFAEKSLILLNQIKNAKGTFSSSELEAFMTKIKCASLKAKNTDKSDIRIKVHDLKTSMEPILGFSIKSKLGNPSTLLNAGHTTNFIYRIDGPVTDSDITGINSINTSSKIKDRLNKIKSLGCNLIFCDMENEIFKLNLQVIDSNLPFILSEMLIYYYEGRDTLVKSLVEILERLNPCNFNSKYSHDFYKYKVKNFLTDVALGMTPSKVWNGRYDATGGYIVVREDGEVLCYHIYNRNEFQEYLLKNTKLDTASSNRHGFGTLYKKGADYFLNLNLQIRFI